MLVILDDDIAVESTSIVSIERNDYTDTTGEHPVEVRQVRVTLAGEDDAWLIEHTTVEQLTGKIRRQLFPMVAWSLTREPAGGFTVTQDAEFTR